MAEPYELLIHCASQGDISQLDAVLTNHKDALDVNFQTEGGLNLLMHAVISAGSNINPKGRYLDVVKVLIRAGILLAVADTSYGRTVLHWTVYYDREDILTELLAADSEDLCKIPDFSGLSPFHLAIQSNSIKCFEVFLAHLPADILEYPDTQGRKPLMLSIIEGNLEAFVLLLNAGVDLINYDPSPLYLSAQCGQTEMLELLLKLVQVNAAETNNDGQTIAHVAATQSSPEMIQVVARYKPELLQSPDNRGITPLMYACGYGIDTNVKVLIKKKVPLDTGDNEGKTCIHWASESQAVKASKCIQLLCKALPSLIELTDQQGRTPFHVAAISGNSNNLEMLVNLGCNVQAQDSNNCTALHWAAASGQFECIAALVKLGIPVDAPNKQGVMPVHFAASSGNEDSLKYLLEAGCDIESKDDNQRTPIHWAAQDSGSIKCLQLLIMLGANFDETDAEGLNALHIACRNDNLAACQYLIETARCNGNAVDPEGQTALFYALEAVSLRCMEFLLSRGSNCNHQNNEGRSLAHLAASIGSLETLVLLAQYGADFELQTSKGIKPIHDAAANGQADVLEYLASVGCDIFAQTLDGSTILHYSAVNGYSTCVKMILDSNFDPNMVLTTEEGDKLTPLDCAEAYEHLETAAVIESAGGKHYKSFEIEAKENITATTTDDKASETFADENSACDQQLPDCEIHNNQTDNQIPVEFQLVNSAQHDSEEEVKPLSSVTDQSINSDKSRPVTSQLANAFTADSVAKNNQASETGTVQDIRYQNDQTVATAYSPLTSKSFKVKSNSSLFAKAISFIRGQERKPSIVSSSVALYGAQATILAGAIIGSPLGNKAMEIGEKVARNVAEDIKEVSHLSQTLPALLWEESVSPTPSPTPTPPSTPSPEPVKPPSPVEVNIDLYEKRIRKARAQLDEMKTPAFLAIQELLKAEATHIKLTKQFAFARLEEHLEKTRAEHKLNEIRAEQESQEHLVKQNKKIGKINATSEAIHSKIDKVLGTATTQNATLNFTLQTMGISPNPTVSEWIKRKQEQKKENMQSTLISWDVQKLKREESIKMKQLLTSERATKHAAWDSEKNIQQKIKYMRDRKIPSICYTPMHSPSSTSTGHFKSHIKRSTTISESKKDKLRDDSMKCSCNVQFTPTGLRKVSIEGSSSTHKKMNQLWKLGNNVAQGNLSSTKVLLDETTLPVRMRATGPKTYHVGRTLMFVSPDKYRKPEKGSLLLKNKSLQQNINLESNHTVQYHSHTKDLFII